MREVKGFASFAENDFYNKMILTARNNLKENIDYERKKIPELEAVLAKNIYHYSISELISEQLTN